MFESVPSLPADPILGLGAEAKADQNPHKVDMGVGIYKTEAGDTPVLAAVKAAERRYLELENSKAYLPPAGTEAFLERATDLVFGADCQAITAGRVTTVQGPGGCGSLRIAAELINRAKPGAKVWVSEPSWPNHKALLGGSGLEFETYPYYDSEHNALAFDAMMAALATATTGDLVLIHASCHNPSGADLSEEQWRLVAELAAKNGFVPFIDMAYQGFARGPDEDAFGIRLMADSLPELVVANSFSKNFGLYRERVGTISFMAQSAQTAANLRSQLLSIARAIYSMPPAHGAALVETILSDTDLKQAWLAELESMRLRIIDARHLLVAELAQVGCNQDYGFISQQNGMFSFLGLAPDQVAALKQQHSVYMIGSSRINLCAVNSNNVAYIAKAIAAVGG